MLSGPAGTPRFWARREIELIPPGLPVQPHHVAVLAQQPTCITRIAATHECLHSEEIQWRLEMTAKIVKHGCRA